MQPAPLPPAPAGWEPGRPRPWLSVLVPVYNVEPYLRECVASVLAEADEGVELLLLDDASTDGSAALMRALAAEHPGRIGLLAHERNGGLSAARNTLLAAARGEHLWFLDSDDAIGPSALPRLRSLLTGSRDGLAPDLVFFDYRVLRAVPRLKHRLRGEGHRVSFTGPARQRLPGGPLLLAQALASGNLFSWAHVSRRRLWDLPGQAPLRFPVGRSFEDMATTPWLLLRAASAWHEPQPWVLYRRRDDSISAVMSAAKVRDLSRGVVGLREAVLTHWPEPPRATRFAVAHQAARNFIAALRHAARLPERAELMQEARRDFDAALGPERALLMRGYLLRGWWWRALTLRRACAATDALHGAGR